MKSWKKGLLAALACAFATAASAQATWPAKQITLVVPYAPGGVTDVIARMIAEPLGERLGQRVLVENKPGGAGMIGTDQVADSAPDGYTLLMMVDTNTIAPSLYPRLKHDPLKSFAPITLLAKAPQAVVAHASFPAKSLPELIAVGKSSAKPLLFASAGNGTSHHLAMERIALESGIKAENVPYKGGAQAINDLVAGQVGFGVIGIAPVLPHVATGKLKVLATTGAKRSPLLPDVPTVAEAGLAGFETFNWFGLVAPAGTPQPVIDRLHREVVGIVQRPDVVKRLADMSLEITPSRTPAAFGSFIAEDIAKWPALIRAADVKPN